MRINYIRECINKKIVEIAFIKGEKNVADMLSKPLPPEVFERHRKHLLEGWSQEEFQGNFKAFVAHEIIPEGQETSI